MLGMTGASDGEEGVATGQAKTKMEALEEEIRAVEVEIEAVEKMADAIDLSLSTSRGITDREALCAKKKRLSEEEGQLREKRLLLLKRRPPTADSVSSTSGTCFDRSACAADGAWCVCVVTDVDVDVSLLLSSHPTGTYLCREENKIKVESIPPLGSLSGVLFST